MAELHDWQFDAAMREVALKAWNAALLSASKLIDVSESEIRLSAGEMTPDEMLTTKAVLGGRAAVVRHLLVPEPK